VGSKVGLLLLQSFDWLAAFRLELLQAIQESVWTLIPTNIKPLFLGHPNHNPITTTNTPSWLLKYSNVHMK
jgi:hypothetical protein